MRLIDNKAIQIALKNLKEKTRQWQYLFFSLLIPIMFTVMFYFILGDVFDYGFSGMIMYATGLGTMNAAIMFANEKGSGMLDRLDTMPTGRKNIFLGAVISESLFLMLQIGVMFIIGYVFLGLYFSSPLALFFGFLIAVLFGISSVGIGIIIASISKTVEIANAFSLLVFMLLAFISGSMVPFDSPIVYFTPPFWAKQIFLQITVMGHGLDDFIYSSSLIEAGATVTAISLGMGLLIIIMYTVAFVLIGILIFQKKTKF